MNIHNYQQTILINLFRYVLIKTIIQHSLRSGGGWSGEGYNWEWASCQCRSMWKRYCDLPIAQSEHIIGFSLTHTISPRVVSINVHTNSNTTGI